MLHFLALSVAIITIPERLTPIILYCREAFSDGTLVIFTCRSPLKHLLLRGYLLLSANLCLPWFQLHLPQFYRSVFLCPCSLNILISINLTLLYLTDVARRHRLVSRVSPGQAPSLVSRACPCISLDRCQTSGRTSFDGRDCRAPRMSSSSSHWSSHSGRQGSGGTHSGRR